MDIKVTKKAGSKVSFHIKATGEEIARFFDRAVEILARDLSIKGFRPGRVPVDMARDALGPAIVHNQAQELAINDTYFEMVTKEKLVPLSSPEGVKINSFTEKDGIDWEGEIDVIPDVKLGDWKKKLKSSKVKEEEAKLDSNEVEETLNIIAKQLAQLEPKDPTAHSASSGQAAKTEKGDWVSIDIDVADHDKFDPIQLQKFQSKNFALVIGEANFIPGFEDNLVGMEKDDEKEFDAKFPDNYGDPSVAGQTVRFKVKLHDIKKVILPAYDDEFAKKFGHDDIDKLKKAIADDMMKKKKQEAKNKFEDQVLNEVISQAELEVPGTLLEQEKDMILGRLKHDLEHHRGVKFSDYLTSLNSTEEKIKEGFQEQALRNVKTGLVLGQITKDEGVEVNDRDIEEAMSLDIINQTAGMPSDGAKELEGKIKDQYKDEQFLSSIKNSIMARKTIDLIVNEVKS